MSSGPALNQSKSQNVDPFADLANLGSGLPGKALSELNASLVSDLLIVPISVNDSLCKVFFKMVTTSFRQFL